MTQRWTRDELAHLLAARHGQPETQGVDAYLDLRMKVTPEFLEALLGGTWRNRAGIVTEFLGVEIDDNGYATPILRRVDRSVSRG